MTVDLSDLAELLPADRTAGTLVGRVWDPAVSGPSVVALRDGLVIDLSARFSTMAALTESVAPAALVASAAAGGGILGDIATVAANTPSDHRDVSRPSSSHRSTCR